MNHKNKLENQLEQKLQHGKSITLTEKERARMSSFLSSYIELNPRRENSGAAEAVRSPFAFFLLRAVPALVIALFFVSSGLAMAEGALPGDPLYALKTAHEDVRGRFSLSLESKARWDAARVERRLSEARELALTGTLSDEASRQLKAELDAYALSLETDLSTLEENNKAKLALEIGSEYRSTVRVYKNLLSRLSAESEEVADFVASLVTRSSGDSVAMLAKTDSDPEPTVEAVAMLDAEVQPVAIEDVDESEEVASGDTVEKEPTEEVEVRVMAFGAAEAGSGSQTTLRLLEEGHALSTETLEIFVAARLGKTEALLSHSDVSGDLKKELEERMNSAQDAFAMGKGVQDSNPEEAREHFRSALEISEDTRTILRISETVSEKSIIEALLDDTSANAFDALELILEVDEGGENEGGVERDEEANKDSAREEGESKDVGIDKLLPNIDINLGEARIKIGN